MEVAGQGDAAVDGINAIELAERFVQGAESMGRLKKGALRVWKVPTEVGHGIKMYRQSLEPTSNKFVNAIDNVQAWWNYGNLNLKGSRLANNLLGSSMFAAISGVEPWTVRGMTALYYTGKAMRGRYGRGGDELAQAMAKVYELPGISSSAFTREVAMATGAGSVGEKLAQSPYKAARALGWWGNTLQHANEVVEDTMRAASALYHMTPGGTDRMKSMMGLAAEQNATAERILELNKQGVKALDDTGFRQTVDFVNKYHNDYKRVGPLERMVLRRAFPYHKFYTHSARMLLHFPFEQPVKAAAWRKIGEMAINDVKETLQSWGFDWNKEVPEEMRTSIPLNLGKDEQGSPIVAMLSTKGANPFSLFTGADPYGEALNALGPIAKVAIEQATAVNLFTRQRFRGSLSTWGGRVYDPKTGEITDDTTRPNIVDHFLRQFSPYTTLKQLVAAGRKPTDTATLWGMIGDAAGTWQYDPKTGAARTSPRPYGAMAPIAGVFGMPPVRALEVPTAAQASARERVISDQFADLIQNYPELEEALAEEIRQAGGRVAERARSGIGHRPRGATFNPFGGSARGF